MENPLLETFVNKISIECAESELKIESVKSELEIEDFSKGNSYLAKPRVSSRKVIINEYKCNLCDYEGKGKSLKRHMKQTHGQGKEEKCTVCEFKTYIFIMKVYISCPKILNVTNVNIILLLRNIFRGMNKEHI